MNRSHLIIAFLFLLSPLVHAQTEDSLAADPAAWTKSLVGNVSVTQAAYDNWTAGGNNTVAFKTALDGKVEKTADKIRQTHTGQFAFGKSRIQDQGVRKIDDLLRYHLEIAYDVVSLFKPVITLDARTQIDKGYDYSTTPNTVIAQFLSPGYVVETIGVSYEPKPWAKFRLGAAAKQTIVEEESLRARYGLEEDASLNSEFGVALGALVEREVVKNVFLKSELDVFEAADNLSHPDVRLKNLVQMKVNQFLNVNLEVEFYYDNDASEDLQVRQTLGLGIGVTLL